MTKSERLQQIKMQDKMYKAFDKVMDAGWKAFVDENRANNKRSNDRIFRLLDSDFVNDFKKLMKSIGKEFAKVCIIRKPLGACFKDSRWVTIPEIWIDLKSYGGLYNGMNGSVSVKITESKWLTFQYEQIPKK